MQEEAVKQVPANILPKPHSWQQRTVIKQVCLLKGSVALYAGKRWGKTFIAAEALVIAGTADPGLYWWVGLTWKSASMKRAWRTLRKWHRQIWQAKGLDVKTIEEHYVRKNEKELYFPDGFVVWFRTAEHPESIQGEGVKGIVVDEAAFMDKDVYYDKIEPCTIDFAAWVILMSSSNDDSWFEDFWQNVKNGGRKTWIALEATTFENPKWQKEPQKSRLEEIIANTPPDKVNREYFCIRSTGTNKAFDPVAIKECTNNVSEIPYNPKYEYVAYVDGSGGGSNAYTLSISHEEIWKINGEDEIVYVQDVMMGISFANVNAATKLYAQKMKEYNVQMVLGDKYSGQWIVSEFLENDIFYEQNSEPRTELYTQAIVISNQRRCRILKNTTLLGQIVEIQNRRVGVHYVYDHPANGKDDYSNAWAGNIYQLKKRVKCTSDHIKTEAKSSIDFDRDSVVDADYDNVFDIIDVIQ